jgi:hypothetical protein
MYILHVFHLLVQILCCASDGATDRDVVAVVKFGRRLDDEVSAQFDWARNDWRCKG